MAVTQLVSLQIISSVDGDINILAASYDLENQLLFPIVRSSKHLWVSSPSMYWCYFLRYPVWCPVREL